MNDTELKERYAQEPWGKLLIEMGMEPYDTESSARRVAEYAATKMATAEKLLRQVLPDYADEAEHLNGCKIFGEITEKDVVMIRDFLANADVVARAEEPTNSESG